MYKGIKFVKAIDDYKLILVFENNEERIFDMKKYLEYGIFRELKDIKMFQTVHVCFDTIEWDNGADMDPEILYEESIKLEKSSA